MRFEDFIMKGQAKRASRDNQLAKSLINTAKEDLRFLETLTPTRLSVRKLVSNYYDVLRSLLEAHAAVQGFKIYSHEAFTYYLIKNSEDAKARKFERFRKIRNAINYYGKTIDVDEAEELISEIKQLIGEVLADVADTSQKES